MLRDSFYLCLQVCLTLLVRFSLRHNRSAAYFSRIVLPLFAFSSSNCCITRTNLRFVVLDFLDREKIVTFISRLFITRRNLANMDERREPRS